MTREEIDQRRADFVAGAYWMSDPERMESRDPHAAAAKRFPYPTQPRVVKCAGTEYRINPDDGGLQYRYQSEGGWAEFWGAREVAAFKAMLTNPTEDTP